jgi:hypothetical protein
VKDPLFVHRRLPNEQASKEYLVNTYGPAAQKTFTGALEAFFSSEFPQLAGDRARRSVVQGIVEMVHRFFPATSNLRQGQTTWISVAKNEVSSYGKSITETRMVPFIVSLLAEDEAQQRRDGKRLRDIKREAVARVCLEIDAQGGCVTGSELAIMFKTTPTTVGKYIAHWEAENHKLLPRRGTIHDNRATTTYRANIAGQEHRHILLRQQAALVPRLRRQAQDACPSKTFWTLGGLDRAILVVVNQAEHHRDHAAPLDG